MLVRLELKLKSDGEINYQMMTLFHGALIEALPPEYADYLHLSQLHPYTQHLEFREGSWYWIVCGLNKEAVQKIIHEALMPLESIVIKKKNLKIDIVEKHYKEMTYRSLMDRFYEEESDRYIRLQFVSPTAFKQRGRYVFYPEMRCVFQSLMNKYDSVDNGHAMIDENTLEQLTGNAQIVRYDLKSVSFCLEGVKIPAFIGKVTIKMHGSQTMTNFANMLFEFGEYSGVGIKTALGMGCIKLIRERGRQ